MNKEKGTSPTESPLETIGPLASPTPEPRCNCNDEFATEVCPVCTIAASPISEDAIHNGLMVITDADLVPEKIRQWPRGFAYICRSCGEPAILDYTKHCCECGAKVLLKSHLATELVREDQKRRMNTNEYGKKD